MDNASPSEGRKLASIQRVKYIKPIEGKDKIVLAQVLGYQLIVQKNDFFADNCTDTPLCVYFEIDTVLDPTNPTFEFLRPRKWRIQIMKMAGVFSEGLALPLSVFNIDPSLLVEGQDVTEELKVKKYLHKSEMKDRYPNWRMGKNKPSNKVDEGLGEFPVSLIPKTDETNLKSDPTILMKMLRDDSSITVTEKYDGMSATYFNGRVFSRNFEHILDKNGNYNVNARIYHLIRNKYKLDEKTKSYPTLAFQGEIVGPECNKNRLGLSEVDFFVFNIFDTANQWFLSPQHVVELCDKLGLKHVPILVFSKPINELKEYQTLESMMKLVEDMKYPNGFPSEGIVVKSDNRNLSFKVVSRVYLEKIK
jgi:RNA ligase (TIGR02306 family)